MLNIEIRKVTNNFNSVIIAGNAVPLNVFKTQSGDFEGIIALNLHGSQVADLYVKTTYRT
jgi:hypothetical protein